jgi:hypothetical protein
VGAWGLFDAIKRTHRACCNAHEGKLTYLRRFKGKKLLTKGERVAERLLYSIFFDIHAGDRSADGVDGLLAALDDKRLEVNLLAAAKGVNLVQTTTDTMRQPHQRQQGRPNKRKT